MDGEEGASGMAGGLRFRFWVAGHLAHEQWTEDPAAAGEIAAYHQGLADVADDAGARWMIEIFDPDAPSDLAYIRAGTDAAGMIDPQPMTDEGIPGPVWYRDAQALYTCG